MRWAPLFSGCTENPQVACVCARAHVLILLGLLFLEISVHLGSPAIILSLQTFSKDDQIALLEKNLFQV